MKIFIVDDDALFSTMLKDELENNFPSNVESFNNGEDFIKQIYANPDVVILDYHLSGEHNLAKDGYSIFKEMKKLNPHVPVIFLSGQEHYGLMLSIVKDGVYRYFNKDEDAFKNVINAVRQLIHDGKIH